jgi:hypothetical protein
MARLVTTIPVFAALKPGERSERKLFPRNLCLRNGVALVIEAARHSHPHIQILALHIACADIKIVEATFDRMAHRASANHRAIATLRYRWRVRPTVVHELRVIYCPACRIIVASIYACAS